MDRFIIGIDIGGTNIRIGAVDKNNKVYYFNKVYQKRIFVDDRCLEHLIRFIDDYIQFNNLKGLVDAISIAVPATVNKECTTVMQAPSLNGFDGLNIVEQLENYFGIKTILMKDVWTAAVYDMEKYGIDSEGIVNAVYIGTGIGNVFLIDGKIVKGKNGVAGELGHAPILGDQTLCGCGNRGCIENYAGGRYLAAMCQNNKVDISRAFIDSAREDIDKYVESIAVAIAAEINILDPDQLLIGGGVLQMEAFPKDLLEKKIREHTRKPYPEENLRIVFVDDDPDKGAVGAAMYARSLEVSHA